MNANLETQGKVLRTMFWTFLALTLIFTCYEFAVESYGLGVFVPNQSVGKFHMYFEAHLAGLLSMITAIPLAAMAAFGVDRKVTERRLGLTIAALWLIYFLLPRY